MTLTILLRRITLHFSHIFFTEERTFIVFSSFKIFYLLVDSRLNNQRQCIAMYWISRTLSRRIASFRCDDGGFDPTKRVLKVRLAIENSELSNL
jgi:hypothetical protein